MSSTKRFFLVYVSLIAIANSVHAGARAGTGANGAASIIDALGNAFGKFAPKPDQNGMQGGGLMNFNGGAGQNGMQPVNFQGIPGMNQGGVFPGQQQMPMGSGGAMAGMPGVGQGIGSPLMGPNGLPIIDPTTGQQIIKTAEMAPGSPLMGANGQQIIGENGQPAFVPQPGGMFPGQMGAGGAMAGTSGIGQGIGSPLMGPNGQPIIDPITGREIIKTAAMTPGSPLMGANGQQIMGPNGQPVVVPQPGAPGAGGILSGAIDESVLMDPRLNPPLYEKIMAEAQADQQLMQALERVKLELNAEDAKIVRASLLKPILMRMNLSQAQAAQAAQAQQMQQQQAMTQAAAAARRAEEQRIKTIEVEISRLEQENNQIMADLKRQGVSQEEINSIVSRSRQDALRVAGNPGPQAGMPQIPGAIGAPGMQQGLGGFGAQAGMPQAGGFAARPQQQGPGGAPTFGSRPQQKPGGFPAFGAQAGAPQAGAPGARPQQRPGGFPAFGAQAGAPQAGAPGARPQQRPGGFPAFGAQAGAAPQGGGAPAGGFPQMAF